MGGEGGECTDFQEICLNSKKLIKSKLLMSNPCASSDAILVRAKCSYVLPRIGKKLTTGLGRVNHLQFLVKTIKP